MVLIPAFVPEAFIAMYLPAIYAGLIVGFIATMAIAMKREELHILILTDLVGLAMIFVVSAVGTDLAWFGCRIGRNFGNFRDTDYPGNAYN